MCIFMMLTAEKFDAHEHPCGHLCECERSDTRCCPMCCIAMVIQLSYPSLKLTATEAILHLAGALNDTMEGLKTSGSTRQHD